MDVSVLVCTHNRPERLGAMLATMTDLVIPVGLAWELLVIDNGPPGAGRENEEAAMAFAGRLPVRVVREPAPGLCHARNRGVAEAKGHHICWTDDDTLVDRHWLASYAGAFARHPGAALFGGPILPRLEQPATSWFERRLLQWPIAYVVAHRDLGDEETMLSVEGGRLPWGANFAVRAEEQRRHGYNVELGFSPAHKRTGEETDLAFRILKAGGSGWWVPGARVEHVIPAERQTLSYLAHYYDQAGHTAAFLHDRFPGDNSLAVYGLPRFARFGRSGLAAAAAAAGLISEAARLCGLDGPSLRFLARSFYYRGIADHLSERAAAAAPSAPILLSETGKA